MAKIENSETRYFIDIDLKTKKIIQWDYDQREKLVKQELLSPFHQRVYLSKGQYYKIIKKDLEIK